MNSQTAKPWLATAARLILGIVWVWASWSKLRSPRAFVQVVRAYDATPEWLSKAIGYGAPVLEVSLGLLLILGVAVRLAASVSAFLLLVFLIGLIQAAARGLRLDCGCFGGGGATVGPTSYALDILRDIGLLALAVYLIVWNVTRLSIEQYLARHDTIVAPSAKRMRTEQGRRKYEAQVANARSQARSRELYLNGSLALVVVLVTVIGIGVQAGRAKINVAVLAANATLANGIVYGKKAAATVEIYEDFGCPLCLQFEQATHAQLDKDVKANLAQVRFHPISILDRNSPNRYSTRAANAGLCASDAGVNQFVAFHNILFGTNAKGKQVQPKEGTAGPSDAQLVALAQQAKLTSAQVTTFTGCLQGNNYVPMVEALTENASKKGVTGTPTIFVNGKRLNSADLATLTAAIAAADAKGPAPAPSPTATPTASSTLPTSGSPTPSANTSSPAPSLSSSSAG